MSADNVDVQAIAAALGGVAVPSPHERSDTPVILLPGTSAFDAGPALYVTIGGWRNAGRVAITGAWPHVLLRSRWEVFSPYHLAGWPREEAPRITVSDTKPPAQIAADITRRFLPVYLPLYQRCAELAAQRVAEGDRAAAAVAMLAGIVLGTRIGTIEPREFSTPYDNRSGVPYVKGEVGHHGDTVELKISNLTVADAEWLLQQVRMIVAESGSESSQRGDAA